MLETNNSTLRWRKVSCPDPSALNSITFPFFDCEVETKSEVDREVIKGECSVCHLNRNHFSYTTWKRVDGIERIVTYLQRIGCSIDPFTPSSSFLSPSPSIPSQCSPFLQHTQRYIHSFHLPLFLLPNICTSPIPPTLHPSSLPHFSSLPLHPPPSTLPLPSSPWHQSSAVGCLFVHMHSLRRAMMAVLFQIEVEIEVEILDNK